MTLSAFWIYSFNQFTEGIFDSKANLFRYITKFSLPSDVAITK